MPTLMDIAYKAQKRGTMITTQSAQVTLAAGVENDVFGTPGKRQVTVMSLEQWQMACDELSPPPLFPLEWTTRRCNLLITGYKFSVDDVGKYLLVGSLVLQITGETDPCKKMLVAHPGLEKALTPDWRGGVTCRVIHESNISVGDNFKISN